MADLPSVDPGLAEARRALRGELDRLAASDRRVLITVDDLDRLGPEDLTLIHELAFHPPDGPHLLLLSVSDRPDRHGMLVTRLVQDVLSLPHAGRVDLEPLKVEELRGLLQARSLMEGATGAFVDELHELSEGNLRCAVAWLDHLANWPPGERLQVLSGSQPLGSVPPPPALIDLVGQMHTGVSPDGMAVLRALAIWRRPALVDELARLTGRSPEAIETTLEEVAERNLVGAALTERGLRVWLKDRTVSHVLRNSMPPLTARRLHRTAAGMVSPAPEVCEGPDLVIAAEHYIASGIALDRQHLGVIVRAARWLNDVSRYAQSYKLLTPVVGPWTGHPAASEVPREAYSLLAEAMARFGAWQDARELVEAVSSVSRSGDDRAALLMRAARDHVSRGNDATAMRLYRMLLDDPDLTPAMRLRVAEDAGRVSDQLGHHQEARHLARTAAEDAERLGELELAADIWISYHSLLIYAGELYESLEIAIHALRLARRSRSARSLARAAVAVGNCLADLGPLDRGIRWMRRGMQIAQAAGDSATVAWASARVGELYEDAGDLQAARAAAGNAVQTDVALHRIRASSRSRAALSIIETRRGALAESTLLMDLVQKQGTEGADAVRGVSIALARFEYAVVRNDWEEALSQAALARRRMPDTSRYRTLLVEVIPREVHAAAVLRDEERTLAAAEAFECLLEELPEPLAPIYQALHLAVRADVASACGDLTTAAEGAAAAAEAFREMGYRWRRAAALHREGEARAAFQPDEAVPVLNEAYLEFQAMGAIPRMEAVRDSLRSIGRRAPRKAQTRRGELTARETQVMRLAAEGKHDAEIAAELWISVRTVTTHVHNLLKKLGLRSRHELAPLLHRQEGARIRARPRQPR